MFIITKHRNQIFATIAATMGSFSDGMNFGWTSPTIPKLQEQNVIDENQIIWLEVLITIGGLIGIFFTLYCVDVIGRKFTIMSASLSGCVSWILIASTSNVYVIFLARFIAGAAADVAFVATPMYIAEIANERIRGRLGGLIYVMMLFGLLTVYTVAPFVDIYITALVGVTATLLQIFSFSFMPESPYFSLLKDNKEIARENLKWLRLKTNVEEELETIAEAIKRQQTEKGRVQDLILIKSNRKAVIILTVLNSAQHLCAILVILMNLHTILKQAESVYLDENIVGIVFALIMLVFATISLLLIDRFGRKFLLTTSALLTSVSLFLLGGYFAFKQAGFDTNSVSWLPIFSVMLYAAVYRLGIGLVPIIMTGELFPTNVKAMGMTYADGVFLVFATIVLFLNNVIVKHGGLHVSFFVYAICCVVTAIFCAIYIPETKGKTLEEIQMLLMQ